ncbi:MAG: hypothetical protein ABI465_21970, partial [Ktedonobacteraceae bacterium]
MLRQALFRVIVGTAIALVALLSPVSIASMAAASTYMHSPINKGVVGATNSSPQVQAVYGTNGSFTTPGTGA